MAESPSGDRPLRRRHAAELMAIGRPAILVPLPGALDDNQTPNADILDRAGGGGKSGRAI